MSSLGYAVLIGLIKSLIDDTWGRVGQSILILKMHFNFSLLFPMSCVTVYSGSSVSTFSSHYFPGQPSQPVPMSSYPPQMLPPPPPPSSSRAAPSQHQQQQQYNHQHPFMTSAPPPPPSPSLWGPAPSQSESEFPYHYYCQHQLMQNPNLQMLHKAPPPADAVDLTSSGSSSKRLPPPPTPVNKTPVLPPPSPPSRHLPPSQSASTSPKKPLPRFANLFHFDGLVCSTHTHTVTLISSPVIYPACLSLPSIQIEEPRDIYASAITS